MSNGAVTHIGTTDNRLNARGIVRGGGQIRNDRRVQRSEIGLGLYKGEEGLPNGQSVKASQCRRRGQMAQSRLVKSFDDALPLAPGNDRQTRQRLIRNPPLYNRILNSPLIGNPPLLNYIDTGREVKVGKCLVRNKRARELRLCQPCLNYG